MFLLELGPGAVPSSCINAVHTVVQLARQPELADEDAYSPYFHLLSGSAESSAYRTWRQR